MDQVTAILSRAGVLFDRLSSLLAEDLGTFENGDPAIFVEGGEEDTPNGVEGLQCLIQLVQEGPTYPMSKGQKQGEWVWVVTLINYEKSIKLTRARLKILSAFNCREAPYVPSASVANSISYEQCRITIFAPAVLNPYRVIQPN